MLLWAYTHCQRLKWRTSHYGGSVGVLLPVPLSSKTTLHFALCGHLYNAYQLSRCNNLFKYVSKTLLAPSASFH
jgi:hypothetical protein